MGDSNQWGIRLLLVIVAVVGVWKFITSPLEKKGNNLPIKISDSSKQYSSQINDAFKVLVKECPNVRSLRVTEINAEYFSEVYEYMSRDYGFNRNVEFEVIDKESGHHQWFDVGDGKTPGILIHKQPTADFCRWDVDVNDVYFHPV